MSHTVQKLFAATLVAFATAPVLAQGATAAGSQAVEVTGARPRVDVTALCPAIHTQLPDALARTFNETGDRGMVDVLLTVKGGYVGKVQTLEGPAALQRAVRLAVRRNVECTTPETTPQQVYFRVAFPDESLRSAGTDLPRITVLAQR